MDAFNPWGPRWNHPCYFRPPMTRENIHLEHRTYYIIIKSLINIGDKWAYVNRLRMMIVLPRTYIDHHQYSMNIYQQMIWWWLEHDFYKFPFSWECHHHNWQKKIQRGRAQPPTSWSFWSSFFESWWYHEIEVRLISWSFSVVITVSKSVILIIRRWIEDDCISTYGWFDTQPIESMLIPTDNPPLLSSIFYEYINR